MPTFHRGNLWDEYGVANLLLVTTNAVITPKGNLVMGRGSAKEAAMRWPDFPKWAGDAICAYYDGYRPATTDPPYGVLTGYYPSTEDSRTTGIGLFQTKAHWHDPSRLDIIAASVKKLVEIAEPLAEARIALPFPGIGAGNLHRNAVMPFVMCLPANVHIYEHLA